MSCTGTQDIQQQKSFQYIAISCKLCQNGVCVCIYMFRLCLLKQLDQNIIMLHEKMEHLWAIWKLLPCQNKKKYGGGRSCKLHIITYLFVSGKDFSMSNPFLPPCGQKMYVMILIFSYSEPVREAEINEDQLLTQILTYRLCGI